MEYGVRERLASEFAGVIKSVREEKWTAFNEAAKQSKLDPYVALARLLVRIVEDVTEKKPRGKSPRNGKD